MDLVIILIWASATTFCVMKILQTWLISALKCYAARTDALCDNRKPKQNL